MGSDGTCTPSQPSLRRLFESLYRTRFKFVLYMLQRHGVPLRDAGDVAQDVFRVVYEKMAVYDANRPPEGWLSCLARRAAQDYRRLGENWRHELCADIVDNGEMPSAEDILVHAERMSIQSEQVAVMLQMLSPPLCQVLTMYFAGEMTAPRIARVLDIPVDTVFTRLRRARKRCARLWLAYRGQALPRHPLVSVPDGSWGSAPGCGGMPGSATATATTTATGTGRRRHASGTACEGVS